MRNRLLYIGSFLVGILLVSVAELFCLFFFVRMAGWPRGVDRVVTFTAALAFLYLCMRIATYAVALIDSLYQGALDLLERWQYRPLPAPPPAMDVDLPALVYAVHSELDPGAAWDAPQCEDMYRLLSAVVACVTPNAWEGQDAAELLASVETPYGDWIEDVRWALARVLANWSAADQPLAQRLLGAFAMAAAFLCDLQERGHQLPLPLRD